MLMKRLLVATAAAIALWSWWDYRAGAADSSGLTGPRRRIAVVLSVGGLGDKSFNDSAYEGLLRAVRELGIEEAHGEPADIAEPAEFLDVYAEEGYDLIIGVGFLMKDAVEKAARSHPDRKFALIDAPIDPREYPNCASLLFSEHEGSFLVGALAAMASKSGRVGFVGGMDIPLIHKFKVGYAEGARHVNPECEVLVRYAGAGPDAFHDPVKGKAMAETLFSQGVDVIYHASGSTGNGVIQAAAEHGKLAIGVDANQNYMKPGHVLTSMLKRVDVAVCETIRAVCEERFQGRVCVFGLKEGGIGYAMDEHNRALVTSPMQERVEALKAKILAGEIRVTDYLEVQRGK
ncbi:MAG: BMP family ABC transporter substrate-binding protein [Planctomycetes bacterium]|nr:BMP family ABC transporter substrate-binding protein [Planctomycetota bacterium]